MAVELKKQGDMKKREALITNLVGVNVHTGVSIYAHIECHIH